MFPLNSVLILTGVRTPQARQNGIFLHATPLELSALVAHEAIFRSGVPRDKFGEVIWGVMYQTEGNSVHLAKQTAARAGLPARVPAVLCNRLCCSGLQALVEGARAIHLQESEIVLTGSVDCMSRISSFHLNAKRKLEKVSEDNPVTASTLDEMTGKRMAELADDFARNYNVERAAIDGFAFETRERARMAQDLGFFSPELVPVPPCLIKSVSVKPVDQDQIDGRWPTQESLTQLESPYGDDGRVTRGNVSAFADGAAAIILISRALAHKGGFQPLAAIRSWAIAAAEPAKIGEALVSSITCALERGGVSAVEVDWFDFEEAFAANCVYAMKTLSLPREKVNPQGGALALGHPPATSGLRQLICAANGLRRNQKQFALVAVAAGGSQAISVLIEQI